jgi:predicted RNase H-like HicB family nuclease
LPIHDEVLRAAFRVCRNEGGWQFRPDQVVRLLPHLNASSVRTHIVSRCCVNAPKHHAHTWGYFKRVQRGVYEIMPKYRLEREKHAEAARAVEERAPAYRTSKADRRATVHAVVVREQGWYVAECVEVAVVTQGRTLDEVASALREAISLHLEGEDLDALGLMPSPRLVVQYETSVSDRVTPS